ncbi:MAG: tetratricopeptide repeat protein [Promethearchaeota archaeon]
MEAKFDGIDLLYLIITISVLYGVQALLNQKIRFPKRQLFHFSIFYSTIGITIAIFSIHRFMGIISSISCISFGIYSFPRKKYSQKAKSSLIYLDLYQKRIEDGIQAYNFKNFKNAKEFFIESLRYNEYSADAWFYLGNIQLELQNSKAARQCFAKALEIEPDYPSIQLYIKKTQHSEKE